MLIKTKELIIIISNHTYKLKISPVRKAPLRPRSKKWYTLKNPNLNLALIIEITEKIETETKSVWEKLK